MAKRVKLKKEEVEIKFDEEVALLKANAFPSELLALELIANANKRFICDLPSVDSIPLYLVCQVGPITGNFQANAEVFMVQFTAQEMWVSDPFLYANKTLDVSIYLSNNVIIANVNRVTIVAVTPDCNSGFKDPIFINMLIAGIPDLFQIQLWNADGTIDSNIWTKP